MRGRADDRISDAGIVKGFGWLKMMPSAREAFAIRHALSRDLLRVLFAGASAP